MVAHSNIWKVSQHEIKMAWIILTNWRVTRLLKLGLNAHLCMLRLWGKQFPLKQYIIHAFTYFSGVEPHISSKHVLSQHCSMETTRNSWRDTFKKICPSAALHVMRSFHKQRDVNACRADAAWPRRRRQLMVTMPRPGYTPQRYVWVYCALCLRVAAIRQFLVWGLIFRLNARNRQRSGNYLLV
jgi:hypothetical protein